MRVPSFLSVSTIRPRSSRPPLFGPHTTDATSIQPHGIDEEYYHERLGDNPMYIALVTNHTALYLQVLKVGGVIFLPKVDQVSEISEEMVQAHCFAESGYVRNKYETLPAVGGKSRVVTLNGSTLTLGTGFSNNGTANTIFEEILDTGKGQNVRIVCIDRVLTNIFW